MIDVYIAKLPEIELNEPLACLERQIEIDGVANERARREKYYVWRLLEYAIKNSLGADASRLYFTKGKNRRWSCEGIDFSLSHSHSALAVAVSEGQAVGVDVELIRIRDICRMADYMLTQAERKGYEALDEACREEWLICRWCEKEAIFKSWNESVFPPKKIETSELFCSSVTIDIDGEKYALAVAAKNRDEIRFFKDIKL
jgi:phosphopantetheine--protein transferase-like protein